MQLREVRGPSRKRVGVNGRIINVKKVAKPSGRKRN